MSNLPRVLEPEYMDTEEEAAEYDAMDHAVVNRKFAEDFLATSRPGNDILDLGTGTALIPVELCSLDKSVRIMASDAAVSMLELARYHIEAEGLRTRIQLHHGDAKKLGFADEFFDAVVSNSLIHHIPDPILALKEIVRVTKPQGRVFVRDLARPHDNAAVESLVEMYAGPATDTAKQLFRQSLHAALSLEEIQNMVESLGFDRSEVIMSSDRHWTWSALKK